MPFPVAAAIGAGVGALGNIFSGSANARQSERNYKHRYQWEVQDLKKAGLNPSLAYGHNAPIPATQPLEPLGDSAVRGASSAAQASQATAQKDLLKAQTHLLQAQTADLIDQVKLRNANIATDTALKGVTGGKTQREWELVNETVKKLRLDNEFTRRTLGERVTRVQMELKKLGLEMTGQEIANFLAEMDKPRAKAEAKFYNTTGGVGATNAIQLLRLLGGLIR